MRETFIEVSGRTEDEAIQGALQQIGLDRDEVSVEIVRRAKSGLLGIGSAPALVRVTYMTDEPEAPTAAPRETVKAVTEKPAEAPSAPAKAPEAPVRAAETSQSASVNSSLEPLEGSPKERAVKFLLGLMERMDTAATPEVREEEETLHIELCGPGMGSVIGRRGETLDAIQHLTNYAVNRGLDKRIRVYIDAENYRKKREEILVRLAQKVAEKVVRYRKNMGLEPMNAYERHVIHTALQDMPSVTTYSSGTEPNRRVLVVYDRSKRPTGGRTDEMTSARSESSASAAPTPSSAPPRPHREWA